MRIIAILLIVCGVLALVYGGFSYTQDKTEAKIGTFELNVRETKNVQIPAWAGIARHAPPRGRMRAGAGRAPRRAQGCAAMTWATAAVRRFAYGMCRNSLGPWALLLGPSTPQTIIWALGKPCCSRFISGMVPPWPM